MVEEPGTNTAWVGMRLTAADKARLVGAAASEERSVAWLLRQLVLDWLVWQPDDREG